MTSEPEIEFGYAHAQNFETCAHVPGADRMLCGRKVGRIMVSIEDAPADLHGKCRELLDAGVTAAPVRSGSGCPACGEAAPVEDGLIGQHGSCVGVNLPVGRRQS